MPFADLKALRELDLSWNQQLASVSPGVPLNCAKEESIVYVKFIYIYI